MAVEDKNKPKGEVSMASGSKVGTMAAAVLKGEARAPEGLFNKAPVVDHSTNPVRVKMIKSFIDDYSAKGGNNQTAEVAKDGYKNLINALEQMQTLMGVDLRESLAYLVAAIANDEVGAWSREAVFRFLPEVAKPGVFERSQRLLNMALIYAVSSKSHFHNMCDIEYSVNKVIDTRVRDQIAAYFRA